MRRTAPAALLAALLLSAAAAAPARAAAGGGQVPTCAALAAAALAPEDDPWAKATAEVYQRVYRLVFELTGREAALKVLARGDGFAANAQICTEPTGPAIYVTSRLLELVFEARRYPLDFLGFVLGHELGHRVADLDAAGKIQRPVKPMTEREAHADARGAFFAAAAGFDLRTLACEDCMEDFLAAEGVSADSRGPRKAALQEVLAQFDAYEGLYDAALALSLADFDAEAKAVVDWADAYMHKLAVPVPELQVLRALVLLSAAAPAAPWLAGARFPEAAHNHLRCAPIFPAHSALWEAPQAEATTRGAAETAAAKRDLLAARTLLESAALGGASPLVTTTGQACVSFYLGEHADAERRLAAAAKLAGAAAPPGVAATLAADRALVAWGRFLAAQPLPPRDDAAATAKWHAALAKQRAAFDKSPQLAALLQALGKAHPEAADLAGPAAAPPPTGCPAPKPAAAALSRPLHPQRPRAGGCPCGWSEISRLSADPAGAAAAGGILTCVPQGWGFGQRYVDIQLPAADDRPAVDLTLHLALALDPAAADLGAWERACQALEPRGASDGGQRAFAGCWGPGGGAILFADQCRVARAVQVQLDPGLPATPRSPP